MVDAWLSKNPVHAHGLAFDVLTLLYSHSVYLLLGWVEVFRSSFKKHSDLLALGDVDWQLDEGLQAQKTAENFVF